MADQQNLTDFIKRGGKVAALLSIHKSPETIRRGRPEHRLSGLTGIEVVKVMNTGLKPVWAGRTMRLDPFRLPQVVSYSTRDEYGDVTFTIDFRGAVMRRILDKSQLPVTIALPAQAFIGVAARAMEDDLGNVTVTLELLHNDPMLSVPLLVAADLDDVSADWHAWSEAYGLPMLLIEADGIARTLEESLGAAIKTLPPQGRRQGKSTNIRRPRFLVRRKMGDLGLRLVIGGEEIIAPM